MHYTSPPKPWQPPAKLAPQPDFHGQNGFAKISLSLPRSSFVEFCSAARQGRYNSGIPTWFPADGGRGTCSLPAPIFSLLRWPVVAESRLRATVRAFRCNGKCPTAVGHSPTYT